MSAGGAGPPPDGLVHGMGKELVAPDWPPLTDDEVRAVLAGYPGLSRAAGAVITWRSPRPMSAAALIRWPAGSSGPAGTGGPPGVVFIKRHHGRVRSVAQLTAEHAFAAHLRDRGVPVPAVLRWADGTTAARSGEFVYELHEAAAGVDLYREAMSWSPFTSPQHARAAGAALARLHVAAAGFPGPERPPAALVGSAAIAVAPDPVAELSRFAARLPDLARYLSRRSWRADFERHLLAPARRAGPLLRALPRQWGHGDWHPSNLTWTTRGPEADVAGVLDLGLANRTLAVHDLATALERTTVPWLDLVECERAEADHEAIDALLDGYESVRPLGRLEAAALAEVLPVVHVEFALTEIEYFAGIVAAPDLADLAYDGYLLGHARWFAGPEGLAVLDQLRGRSSPKPSGSTTVLGHPTS